MPGGRLFWLPFLGSFAGTFVAIVSGFALVMELIRRNLL